VSDETLTDAQWTYQRRLKRWVCIRCEGPRTNKEFKTCLECRLEQRATRKSLGRSLLCSQCKKPVVSGKLCEPCRQERALKHKERYDARLAAGLCPQCGKKRYKDTKHKLCERCRKKLRESAPETRARRKELGLCTRCGGRPAIPGSSQCFECREKVNKGHRERRRKNPGREAARSKQFREDMKAKGLCYKCAKPAAAGRTRCEPCIAKESDARRIERARKKISTGKKFEPDTLRPHSKIGRILETPTRAIPK
jgi:hypothetical protein